MAAARLVPLSGIERRRKKQAARKGSPDVGKKRDEQRRNRSERSGK